MKTKTPNYIKTGTWIEISGIITKGDYYGAIPIIKIEKITKISTPEDMYVYPPSQTTEK